jgi:hypothetical protein
LRANAGFLGLFPAYGCLALVCYRSFFSQGRVFGFDETAELTLPWAEDYWAGGVAAFRGEAPAHVHQLLEGFSVFFAEGSCEAVPPADFLFQSDPVGLDSLSHTLSLYASDVSDVSDVREYEVLFCEGFVD